MSSHPFSKDNLARWFFILLALVVFYVFAQIISPFFLTILTAVMVAVLVTPFERWLRERLHHPRISTAIVLLLVATVIIGPLAIAGIIAARQAVDITQWFLTNPDWMVQVSSGTQPFFFSLPRVVQDAFGLINFPSLVQIVAEWTKTHGAEVFSSGAALVFKIFIFFICLYFFLVDREKILREVILLSPLKDSVDKNILARMVQTVRGVVFGSLIVACIQGVIAAVGLTLFGVPGALIWAGLVVIAAQIPMLGTSTIMLPAVLYLFITGNVSAGIGLLVWSMFAVGLVDNLLQPFIVGGSTRMHALLILLSMLGGLQYFGPIGFIFGPTVLAALLVILEMYKGGFFER